jgi:hypothetical protein
VRDGELSGESMLFFDFGPHGRSGETVGSRNTQATRSGGDESRRWRDRLRSDPGRAR